MLTLALVSLLAADPAPKPETPPASDMAILYFLAGDLRRAVDTARAGLTSDAKRCKALYPMLVEYEFLVPKREEMTVEQARDFLAWDKKISPKSRGKLTGFVVQRYVETPLRAAQVQLKGGDVARARKLIDDALTVGPANTDGLALRAQLGAPDAGR